MQPILHSIIHQTRLNQIFCYLHLPIPPHALLPTRPLTPPIPMHSSESYDSAQAFSQHYLRCDVITSRQQCRDAQSPASLKSSTISRLHLDLIREPPDPCSERLSDARDFLGSLFNPPRAFSDHLTMPETYLGPLIRYSRPFPGQFIRVPETSLDPLSVTRDFSRAICVQCPIPLSRTSSPSPGTCLKCPRHLSDLLSQASFLSPETIHHLRPLNV